MNPERSRIQADLSGLIEGDVLCDDLFLQMYSTDASILQIRPLGVVRPKSTKDVVAVAKYATENRISLHPRGSGSNVVGAAIGSGLVIDFSTHLHRTVSDVGPDQIRVQPGVVLANLNRQLARSGSMFGPDPANRSVTTLGGVISMDSTGSHWLKYGSPRDKIRKLQVVFADGSVAEFGKDSVANPIRDRCRRQVASVLARNQGLIEGYRVGALTNHAGYHLSNLMAGFDSRDPSSLDLTQLLAGSEGTLAMITEATLQVQPIPQHRGVVLLFFDQMQTATRTALEVLKNDVAACDLLDRRNLSIARSTDQRFARIIPADAEAMILVELQADSAAEIRQRVGALADRMTRKKKMAFDVRTTCSVDERNLYWRMARRVIPMQFGMKGGRQPLPFVEDVAVAPEKIPGFLVDVQEVLQKFEVTGSTFIHVGQGIVHIRPQLNLADHQDRQRIKDLTQALFDRVLDVQGTISGSHGDGMVRAGYLRRQYGKLYNVFSEIKNVFDPQGILNPGKIVATSDHDIYSIMRSPRVTAVTSSHVFEQAVAGNGEAAKTRKHKSSPRSRPNGSVDLPVIDPQLSWDLQKIAETANGCNGCSRCKTASPDERMCPIYRLYPREEASPRSKANLMRDFLNGNIDQEHLNSSEFKKVANLCVNCHQCRMDCPAGVDIPRLMVEAKAQHVAVNGLRMSEWILTRLDVLYGFSGRMPHLTNWMMENRAMRWMLDRMFGIAQSRKLPRFATRSFIKWATRRKLTSSSRGRSKKVLYFVDAYANWNDVELAKATCAVLRHNGFEVFVPASQQVSGMSLISAGVIDRAKKIAIRNVELLAEGVRQGCHIVTSEPSAALALKHEYPSMLDEADANMVSDNCTDISNFLWQLHQTGNLELDFSPLSHTVGYHLPCHQRALGSALAGLKLLNLIPGLQVERIEKGCSGMAGTYGLIRQNYRRSLRAGMGLINAVRQPHLVAGVTECSTCKIQMEQGTAKPTLHPVKILALAYGLMPELDNLFDRRSNALVTS